MLCYTVLYYTILYYTILYYAMLCYTVLYYIIPQVGKAGGETAPRRRIRAPRGCRELEVGLSFRRPGRSRGSRVK